ncbi:MAG: CapA family protein [Fusobacteriaceae bacterium]|jgi:poly-gamma-glutamate synthesis protein (capsule biosynthesis protein)|nr:CapA family protein [Fusobacteriaceae bacterium]
MKKKLMSFLAILILMLSACREVRKSDYAAGPSLTSDTIRIAAIFDVMNHAPARTDFSGIYSDPELHRIIRQADIAFAQLETPVTNPEIAPSGYPAFNTHINILKALKELGVDIVSTANNHTLDKGFEGLSQTIVNLDSLGFRHVGTKRLENEKNYVIYSIHGKKLAFLAYTYGTNGLMPPAGKAYSVNYINREKISADIADAKADGADFLIASMHWGVEYEHQPNATQEALAKYLSDLGVGLIIGHHPHVIQPVKMIGNTLTAFSGGNFVSGQAGLDRKLSYVLEVDLKKDKDSGVRIADYRYKPIGMRNDRYGVEIKTDAQTASLIKGWIGF